MKKSRKGERREIVLQYLLILSARRGNDYLIRRDNERALGGSRALIIAELHGKRNIFSQKKSHS